MDVVVAGGHGKVGLRKRSVDYGGAVKLIEAAKTNGIDRYVITVDRPVYTIVRPGGLTDDVAATLYFTLDAVNTYGQAFDVVAGDDPVEDAVRAL